MKEEQPRVIPLTQEELSVTTRKVETGRVRVSTRMLEHTGLARADLYQEDVKVEHVPIGREVDAAPPIREEGDTIIIPIVEEIMVVEKRLVLREEVRITRTRSVEAFEQPVQLRTMVADGARRAAVERLIDRRLNQPHRLFRRDQPRFYSAPRSASSLPAIQAIVALSARSASPAGARFRPLSIASPPVARSDGAAPTLWRPANRPARCAIRDVA